MWNEVLTKTWAGGRQRETDRGSRYADARGRSSSSSLRGDPQRVHSEQPEAVGGLVERQSSQMPERSDSKSFQGGHQFASAPRIVEAADQHRGRQRARK